MTRYSHDFGPIFDMHSRILILGSFPSKVSREDGFYYAHPRNRFWKVLSAVYQQKEPITKEEKTYFLLKNKTALWDTVAECEVKSSSDSSIKNVKANDILFILNSCDIRTIYANGKTAASLYDKYVLPYTNVPIVILPSTSPANAAWSLERLTDEWRKIKS